MNIEINKMKISTSAIWDDIKAIRKDAPLVHNITNYVVMNTTANALLAIGASPVMAHAKPEISQMAGIAASLVINIGTLSDPWIESMLVAGKKAEERHIPVILDPVGAGATDYRTDTAHKLMNAVHPSIIRGNASEIMAITRKTIQTKGVDSINASDEAIGSAQILNRNLNSIICISGACDYIVSSQGNELMTIKNGHTMMPHITGMGCTASALCGAFAAVNPKYDKAAAHAMAVMGIAGEIAGKKSKGPASFQIRFIDALYQLTQKDINQYFMA